jgi:glycosyltransferase involved in cell wall biosynthesis
LAIRVSTIIAVFNGAATLRAAIDSALAQEFEGQEIVVVNDGSTDGTAAILSSYGDRIRTVEQANRGFNRSRIAAIRMACGEYLAFLDADDIWLPGRLARTCAALERNPGAVLAFTEVIPMDEKGDLGLPWKVNGAPTLKDLMTHGWRIYPSAVTIRRSAYAACGGFDEQLTNLSDAYLWMRARELGGFEYVTEPLVIYRAIDFRRIGDKYSAGLRPFARAVRRRYGRAARPVMREMKLVFASSLAANAVDQLNHGAISPACRSLARAIRISPSFFLGAGVARRMFRPRNFRKLTGSSSTDAQD